MSNSNFTLIICLHSYDKHKNDCIVFKLISKPKKVKYFNVFTPKNSFKSRSFFLRNSILTTLVAGLD